MTIHILSQLLTSPQSPSRRKKSKLKRALWKLIGISRSKRRTA